MSSKTFSIPPRILWPGLVLCICGMSVTICTLTVTLASSDASFGVEEAYYEKALRWDETVQQREINAGLGWDVRWALGAEAGDDGRRVGVSITAPDGSPVGAESVSVYCFHKARRAEPMEFVLKPTAPGVYAATAELPRDGFYEMRLTVRGGEQLFTDRQSVETGAKPDATDSEGGAEG